MYFKVIFDTPQLLLASQHLQMTAVHIAAPKINTDVIDQIDIAEILF